MNNEPTNITLPKPPTGHVWQYRGIGWNPGKPVIYAYVGNGDTAHSDPFPDTPDGHRQCSYWEAVAEIPLVEQLRTELDAAKGIVDALEEEVMELKEWKRQQISIDSSWDIQAVGTELGMTIGTAIHANILPKIKELKLQSKTFQSIAVNEARRADGMAELLIKCCRMIDPNFNAYPKVARLPDMVERLKNERDGWEQTALQNQRNTDYYRSLLEECGKAIGKEAYEADDGTQMQDVLCAKVPELVRDLCARRTTWIRQQINEEDIEFQNLSSVKPEPDHAQQAKDILQSVFKLGTFVRSNQLDNFVDLIIKAAKQ